MEEKKADGKSESDLEEENQLRERESVCVGACVSKRERKKLGHRVIEPAFNMTRLTK